MSKASKVLQQAFEKARSMSTEEYSQFCDEVDQQEGVSMPQIQPCTNLNCEHLIKPFLNDHAFCTKYDHCDLPKCKRHKPATDERGRE